MGRKLAPDIFINGDNPGETKSIVDALLVCPSDEMEIRQRAAERGQMRVRERFDRQFNSFEIATDREAFSLGINIEPPSFAFQRLQTRESLLSQMKQEIELLLHLDFALDLIDF